MWKIIDFILCNLRLCRHKEFYNEEDECGCCNGKSWTITRYECPRCLRMYVKRKKD